MDSRRCSGASRQRLSSSDALGGTQLHSTQPRRCPSHPASSAAGRHSVRSAQQAPPTLEGAATPKHGPPAKRSLHEAELVVSNITPAPRRGRLALRLSKRRSASPLPPAQASPKPVKRPLAISSPSAAGAAAAAVTPAAAAIKPAEPSSTPARSLPPVVLSRDALAERASSAAVAESGCKAATAQPTDSAELVPAPSESVPQIGESLKRLEGLHKPVGLIMASAQILGTACAITGAVAGPMWLPALTGGLVGGLFVALNRAGMRRLWRAPKAPLSIVITGSTQGIGKAMAREFLRAGDRVIVTSRSGAGVRRALAEMREEVGPNLPLVGLTCDVTSPGSVARLANAVQSHLGTVDVWINNAGYSGGFQSFMEASPEQISQVVQTNLLGTLLCSRAALRLMAQQPRGGHVFNMDGAGADGMATPQYAAYGATKAAIAHLMGSLQAECLQAGHPVGLHTLSPGMVLTNLLLEGATAENKAIFNILCEQPETVAAFLVPRVRTIAARNQVGRYVKYLTLPRALLRFLTAPLHANRFFNAQGQRKYADERERILGEKEEVERKRTQRLAAAAARRNRELGVAYSLSIAASYVLIVWSSLDVLKS